VPAPTVLVTGFPGFLGSELLPRILSRRPDARALCLVQGRWAKLAYRRAGEIEAADPRLAGRIDLVEGDIVEADLGLGRAAELAEQVREAYHLAAVYDLAVPRETGLRVNVGGTRHVLDFLARCQRFERLHYVSTCYVSGRHPGTFREGDLDVGQRFNNFYEETKFLAEVEVRERAEAGLPTTVYRPSITVGDSATGATQKYDGPYYILRWMMRQPRFGVMPTVGDPRAHTVNLVPRDFVVLAIDHLSALAGSLGKVYQLCDPAPLTVDALIRLFARATGRRILRVPVPLGLAQWALDHVPGLQRLMGTPSQTLDYFVHPTDYACDNTLADLEASGIAVPPFATYVDRLVAFVRAHPEVGSRAMT
jgi:thioester reductase-like protein